MGSINQHYLGKAVVVPPPVNALIIADLLRYYQYRVSATSYRPYISLTEANASVDATVRLGRTVLIGATEYWWRNGSADTDLIAKATAGTGGTAYDDTSIRGLITTLQTEKVSVWQTGAQSATKTYLAAAANGPDGKAAWVQPIADIVNSTAVTTALYNVLAYLPSADVEAAVAALTSQITALQNVALTPTQFNAIQAANNPSTTNPVATFLDLPVARVSSRILYVEGSGQTLPGIIGNPSRPFVLPSTAVYAARAGDTLLVVPGGVTTAGGRAAYDTPFTITRPLLLQGVGLPQLPGFDLSSADAVRINAARLLGPSLITPSGSQDARIDLYDCELGPDFYARLDRTTNAFTTTVYLHRCTITHARVDFALLQAQEANVTPSRFEIILEDCAINLASQPLLSGTIAPGRALPTRVILRGTTTIKLAAGQPLSTVTDSAGVPLPDSYWLVDERAATGATNAVLPSATPNTYTGRVAPLNYMAYNAPGVTGFDATVQPGRLINPVSASNSTGQTFFPIVNDLSNGVRMPAGLLLSTTAASIRTPGEYCQRYAVWHADLGSLDNRGASLTFTIRKISDNSIVATRVFNQATTGPDIPAGGISYRDANTLIFAPAYGEYYLQLNKTGVASVALFRIDAH